MSMYDEVNKYINEHFYVDAFEIEDAKYFPAGKSLKDKSGNTLVVYWDIHREVVMVLYAKEESYKKNERGAGRKSKVDIKRLENLYYNGFSKECMAVELGCSVYTVARLLKKHHYFCPCNYDTYKEEGHECVNVKDGFCSITRHECPFWDKAFFL